MSATSSEHDIRMQENNNHITKHKEKYGDLNKGDPNYIARQNNYLKKQSKPSKMEEESDPNSHFVFPSFNNHSNDIAPWLVKNKNKIPTAFQLQPVQEDKKEPEIIISKKRKHDEL